MPIRPRHASLCCASILSIGSLVPAQDEPSAIYGTLAIDFPSAYFFRGLQQEDQGLIVQPSIEFGWTIVTAEEGSDLGPIDLSFGNWNSFHRGPTGSKGAQDAWYESDVFAGVSVGVAERFSVTAQWARFGNPNATWASMAEFTIALAFDDHDLLADDFSGLQPSVLIATELQGQGDGGTARGTYLQIGIEPSFDLGGDDEAQPFTLSLPLAVGLSLGDYYERPSTGRDEALGFFDVGVVLSTPIAFLPGPWEANLGVHALFLGPTTREVNGGDTTQLIASIGFSTAF